MSIISKAKKLVKPLVVIILVEVFISQLLITYWFLNSRENEQFFSPDIRGVALSDEDKIVKQLYDLVDPKKNENLLNGGLEELWQEFEFTHGVYLRAKAFKIVREYVHNGTPSQRIRVALADILWYLQEISLTHRNCDDFPLSGKWDDFWAWFVPTFSCDSTVRIGRIGDGGKNMCDIHKMNVNGDGDCVLYSFGIKDEIFFDVEFGMLTGCEVHSFDPTITQEMKEFDLDPILEIGDYTTLHEIGIGVHNGNQTMNGNPLKSLQEIAKELGHRKIDVLKLDIEGGEFKVIPDLHKYNVFKEYKIQVVLLEYHGSEGYCGYLRHGLYPILKNLYDEGYLMYAFEVNVQWVGGGEFAFVHRDFLLK